MNARLPQWQIIRPAQDEEPGLRGGEARGRGGLGTMTAQPRGWGTDELSKFLVGCTASPVEAGKPRVASSAGD